MSKTLLIKPRVSEKAYGQSLTKNTYVFVVPTDANRTQVAEAVEAQFNVSVTDVNILNVKGKAKRTVRKGGRQSQGKDNDFKKAYEDFQAAEQHGRIDLDGIPLQISADVHADGVAGLLALRF